MIFMAVVLGWGAFVSDYNRDGGSGSTSIRGRNPWVRLGSKTRPRFRTRDFHEVLYPRPAAKASSRATRPEPPMSTAPAPRHLASYLVPLAVAVAVLLGMQARFMGDTVDYVNDVFEFGPRSWEFGHLAWVPLGTLGGGLGREGVLWLFLAVNAVAGVASVLLLRSILGLVGVRPWTAAAASVALLFAQAMLNFTLTGSSYVPGLACILLALYLALRPGSWRSAVGSGLAMAAAVAIWFPYVLVVPGVLLAPAIVYGVDRRRVGLALGAGIALGVGVLATFGPAAWLVGVRDLDGLRGWVAESSHGVRAGGAARAAFGLARSFVFMGDDGLLFKRYLLHDPYNPVTLGDLARLSLGKLGFFYLMLLALGATALVDPKGRRFLLLALVGGLPVVVFGLFWQGGDMERYMPLYPFFFVLLAVAYDAPCCRGLSWIVAGFFLMAIGVNGFTHSRWAVGRYEAGLADRVRELRPVLKPGSVLIVVRDRLKLLPRDFPLDPASEGLAVYEAATPGLATTDAWHKELARVALGVWGRGGDVWLSKRLFEDAPRADSTWTEGEDQRLTWPEVRAFFASLGIDEGVGGDDGFVRLRDTEGQRNRLRDMTR
jgi:hypothetical protein